MLLTTRLEKLCYFLHASSDSAQKLLAVWPVNSPVSRHSFCVEIISLDGLLKNML